MLEISSVGATVKYAVESVAGERPMSGYTEIPDVSEAPEISLDVEALDASNISDTITRYIPGRADPGGSKSFTLNHTDAGIEAWEKLVTAATAAWADGKQTWFEYSFPNAKKSFFFAGLPQKLGTNGIAQNSVDTIPATVIITDVGGWETASTEAA